MYLTTDIEPIEETLESEQIEILSKLLAIKAESDVVVSTPNEASDEDE
jgi:hypothetical protein